MDWKWLIGPVIGIIGYFAARKRYRESPSKPAYRIRLVNVIRKPRVDKLNITYNRKKIEVLNLTKIIFMNEGKHPIRGEDIVENHKIAFVFAANTRIFDVDKIYESRQANKSTFEIENNIVFIDFAYLNHNDGLVLQVLHDGKTNSSNEIEVKGEIVGINSFRKISEARGEYFIQPFILFGGTAAALITTYLLHRLIELLTGWTGYDSNRIWHLITYFIIIVPILFIFIKITDFFKQKVDAEKRKLLSHVDS